MPQIIRWGILSTANIGRKKVAPAISHSSNGVVHAVASRSRERALEYAEAFGATHIHDSYEALLENPEVDAIYNPLPNNMHAEWAIKSAEAGKPMLCEKPLASDADEAAQIVEAFRSRGVTFAEAFMYRFHPQTTRAKMLLDSGVIGDLRSIDATFTFTVRRADDIRLSAEMAGGSLMDVGCYPINVSRLMTGAKPESVQGHGIKNANKGVDVDFAGVLTFPNGVLAHIASSLQGFQTNRYTLIGQCGRIEVDPGFTPLAESGTTIRVITATTTEEIHVHPVDQYRLMVEDFASAVMAGREPRFPPEDAVANMRVIDQLKAAAGLS